MSKNNRKPVEQRKTQQEIIGFPSNKEALKIVEDAKNLPHLQKPIKYLTKKSI